MQKSQIDRINELARKAREDGLDAAEQAEKAALYQEYLAEFRRNLESQLQNTFIEEENGTRRRLKRREDCE